MLDKNIIYIGGANGIGLATCLGIMNHHPQFLIIVDKCPKNQATLTQLQEKSPKTTLLYFQCDLSHGIDAIRATFEQIFKQVPQVDVLVNGAGVCNDQMVDVTVQVNLLGVINATTVVFDFWNKRKGGQGGLIVNIASVAGLNPFRGIPVYSATKAAVIAFTKGISDLEPITGIRACTVCPGPTKTSILDNIHSYENVIESLNTDIDKICTQTVEECAQNVLEVIKLNQNGGIFISDLQELKSIELTNFWTPQFYK